MNETPSSGENPTNGSAARLGLLAAVVFAVLLLLFVVLGGDPSDESDSATVPVDFELEALAGGTFGPSSYRGKIVVVDFWATWCGPCRIQAEILEELHQEFDSQDVEFLAVSLGESRETVEAFVADRPFPYPVLLDPADQVSSSLGIYALPTVMIVDKNGMMSFLKPGVSSEATLRDELESAGA